MELVSVTVPKDFSAAVNIAQKAEETPLCVLNIAQKAEDTELRASHAELRASHAELRASRAEARVRELEQLLKSKMSREVSSPDVAELIALDSYPAVKNAADPFVNNAARAAIQREELFKSSGYGKQITKVMRSIKSRR